MKQLERCAKIEEALATAIMTKHDIDKDGDIDKNELKKIFEEVNATDDDDTTNEVDMELLEKMMRKYKDDKGDVRAAPVYFARLHAHARVCADSVLCTRADPESESRSVRHQVQGAPQAQRQADHPAAAARHKR